MTVEVTVDLEWQENHNEKVDIEGVTTEIPC